MLKKSSTSFLLGLFLCLNLFAQPAIKKGITWAFYRDLNDESFTEKFDKYKSEDFRLTDIDVYKTPSGIRYAMIWEKNTDDRRWAEFNGITNDEYHTKWEEFKLKNYRPADIEGYEQNGGLRYAGIWVENKENLRWNSQRGMKKQEYEEYITEQKNDGKRLVDTDMYLSGNEIHYAAIFLENKENIEWVERHGLTRTDYEKRIDEVLQKGYLVVNMESYIENNIQRYAFVAEKRDGFGYQLRSDRTELQFANMWREYDDRGLRIIDFECYLTPNGMRYGGVWIENNERFRYNKKNKLDSLLAKYRVDNNNIPGISVAIIKDGDMVYRKGEGYADKEAGKVACGETIYLTASVAKVIAGTIAVKLHDEQRLADGTPVSFNLNNTTATYLTNVRKSDGSLVTIPAHHTHTVKQLFAHLACIHNYETGPGPVIRQYTKSIDALVQFWDAPLLPGCTMGTNANYSNYGFVFVAAILEKVTGRTSPEIVRKEISIPYNIGTLRAIHETENIPYNYDRAVPYKDNNQPTQHDNKSYKVFAGGLELSTVDLCRFGWKVLNGEIVKPAARDNILWTRVNPASSRGIGWAIRKDSDNKRMAEHEGTWVGAHSYIRIYRDNGLVIAIMSNRRHHDTEEIGILANKIAAIVFN